MAGAIAVWIAYWPVLSAADFATDGWLLWAIVAVPNFLLGLATGRWWTALLPFAFVALAAVLQPDPCVDVNCGELGAIPAWLVVLYYLSLRGAAFVLIGVACRRVIDRRRAMTR